MSDKRSMRSFRPGGRARAEQARPGRAGGSTRLRDRSRPAGSTRPSLRQQMAQPVQARRRADPGTVRRFLMFSALLAVMLVVLTPTLRGFLQQRSEIAELKREKAAGQSRVEALSAERKRWEDAAFVKRQAQQRLGFAMPGQKVTVYVDDTNTTRTVPNSDGVTNATGLAKHPWYGQMWGSVSMPSDQQK